MISEKLPLTAVIFDFDGTLGQLNIDFSLMRRSVLDLACDFGISLNGLENLYTLEMIAEAKKMIDNKNRERGEDFFRQAMNIVARIEVDSAHRGALLEGTREMLQILQGRGTKMAVVTRNSFSAVVTVFPDAPDFFGQAIISREFTRHVKPHPDHLLTALKTISVLPQNAAMVGDHPMDMRIARDQGTLAIGVLTGKTGRDELLAAGADFIINRAAELPNLFFNYQ